jgi:hypothetical protein
MKLVIIRLVGLGLVVFLSGWLAAQEINWEEVPDRTALRILCDEPNVPIYVDGHFVGKTPLPDVVDVLPGWHRVSYFPDVSNVVEVNHPKRRRIEDILRLGRQDVLVEPGEIVEVVLSYQRIDAEVEAYQRRLHSGQWVGFSMFLLLMVILAWVA